MERDKSCEDELSVKEGKATAIELDRFGLDRVRLP
jgi:hypothetical protein